VPKIPTESYFASWNSEVTAAVTAFPSSYVAPLHATFFGHGVVNDTDGWFYKDCIHPNAKGHNEIRAMYWKAITGENAP
jgi:lysophospholipase L1-like esterase